LLREDNNELTTTPTPGAAGQQPVASQVAKPSSHITACPLHD